MDQNFIKEDAQRRGVPIIREESHKKLIEIVSNKKPLRILEIGTAVGYSGILMLQASEKASLTTIELNTEKVNEANQNFKDANLSDRVTIINGDCSEVVSLMVAEGKYDKYFDFIFLDGPKAQYINMLESLIMLTQSGGTILADNVLFRGYVKNKEGMPRRFKTIVKRLIMFLDTVANHSEITNFKLYEIEDGMLEFEVK